MKAGNSLRRLGWIILAAGFVLLTIGLLGVAEVNFGLDLGVNSRGDPERLVPTAAASNIQQEYAVTPYPEQEFGMLLTTLAGIEAGIYEPAQRFGIGIPIYPQDFERILHSLGIGWYFDWRASNLPSRLGGVEYVQTVRYRQGNIVPHLDELRAIAINNPGSLWLLGNEPDVIWQDNATPGEYATFYFEVYQAIKEADPTAQIAIGAISQPTPLRLQYLDQILREYRDRYGGQMPIDVWNIHNFILREQRGSWGVDIPPGLVVQEGELYEIEDCGNIELFQAQIQAFRRWMAERGYRDRPLIVSEYGIPMPEDYGYPFTRVRDYMYQTFVFMLTAVDEEIGYLADGNRLVQRWAWYSLSDAKYPTGNLVNLSENRLNRLGGEYRRFVDQLP